jgi:hypothetical protein
MDISSSSSSNEDTSSVGNNDQSIHQSPLRNPIEKRKMSKQRKDWNNSLMSTNSSSNSCVLTIVDSKDSPNTLTNVVIRIMTSTKSSPRRIKSKQTKKLNDPSNNNNNNSESSNRALTII